MVKEADKPGELSDEFARYLAEPWTVADPPALFRRVRSAAPVMKGPGRLWMVTGFDAADEAYRHPSLSRAVSAEQLLRPMGQPGIDPPEVVQTVDLMLTWLIHTDDPQHARLRKVVAPFFSPKAVKPLEGAITALVNSLIDELKARESFDFLHEFCYPIAERFICSIMGVPASDMARIVEWTNRSSGLNTVVGGTADDIRRDAQNALVEQAAYFRSLVEDHRKNPGSDLIDSLLRAEEDGDRLSEDELVGMLMLLIGAGHHTTAHLIANTMLAMVLNPDQWELLKADPSLAKSAIEETLRYDPSSAGQPRVALEDLTIGGIEIATGDQIAIVLRAANRDPARFDDPDSYRILRTGSHHLGFGTGIHLCLGNWLARLEAVTACELMARRMGDIVIDTANLARSRTQSRALLALPARWQAPPSPETSTPSSLVA